MGVLFGPVKSRRLGLSLGLELVPKKICSMDCLYCEVGKTTLHTIKRADYTDWSTLERAILQAKDFKGEYNVLTLTGSGEPTLNIHFERVVELAKRTIQKPIAVLTNSTTVVDDSVREALCEVDLVLASLDAARKSSFRLVNRPVSDVSLEAIIQGLKELRINMKGELWLEVLLVKDINDSKEDLFCLKEAIVEINPHRVQLNTVVRPPAYALAKPLSWEELVKVRDIIGDKAEITTSQVTYINSVGGYENLEELLIDYLTRRPAPFSELLEVFKNEKKLSNSLEKLVDQGKLKRLSHQGEIFYLS